MADQAGEKTHEATPKRLEEALKQGNIPVSQEVQTAFVLVGFLIAFWFSGKEMWRTWTQSMTGVLEHLHEGQITVDSLQSDALAGAAWFFKSAGPMLCAIVASALLAGGIQSRFQTFSEALRFDWTRVNPATGFARLFSFRSTAMALVSCVKLGVIFLLTYGQVLKILHDPIFASAVDPARIAHFLADTLSGIVIRVALALAVIAAADYGFQFWRHRQELRMTWEEVEEEQKNTEGNKDIKAAQRRRRQRISHKKMLQDVPKADFVVTNPTHLAVALRYDRKTMKAPVVLAKGSRLNALRIREIATQHQVPIIENKPLARMLFRHARVGGEIPADFYAAVAELLAYVYRVNRYRYYTEQNRGSQ